MTTMPITTMPIEGNTDYQEEPLTLNQISELRGRTLIEFGAPWCAHCQASQPVIKEVLADHADLAHIKIYDGKGKKLGRSFVVKRWPTFILLNDGEEVARLVRPIDAGQVRQFLD